MGNPGLPNAGRMASRADPVCKSFINAEPLRPDDTVAYGGLDTMLYVEFPAKTSRSRACGEAFDSPVRLPRPGTNADVRLQGAASSSPLPLVPTPTTPRSPQDLLVFFRMWDPEAMALRHVCQRVYSRTPGGGGGGGGDDDGEGGGGTRPARTLRDAIAEVCASCPVVGDKYSVEELVGREGGVLINPVMGGNTWQVVRGGNAWLSIEESIVDSTPFPMRTNLIRSGDEILLQPHSVFGTATCVRAYINLFRQRLQACLLTRMLSLSHTHTLSLSPSSICTSLSSPCTVSFFLISPAPCLSPLQPSLSLARAPPPLPPPLSSFSRSCSDAGLRCLQAYLVDELAVSPDIQVRANGFHTP